MLLTTTIFSRSPLSFWKRYGSGILLLTPLIVFLLCFYVFPLTNLLAQSFSFSTGDTNRHDDWTFYQYLKTYDSARIGRVLSRTFRISLVTVLITLAVSYPLALLLLRASRRLRTALLILTFVSLASSLIVRNYGWVVVLADGGALNSVLIGLGLTNQPIRFMYSEGAIVVGLVHFAIPFMVLPIYGSLLRIPTSMREAALSLGSNEWACLCSITLPLSLPGVFGGTMLTFAVSMSAYVTPLMLGSPSTAMISQVAAEQLLVQLNFPWGAAIIVTLTVLTFLVVAAYASILRKVFRATV
jgi:ABC-type spermidine/putrescine transport system permease subunit I